MKEYKIVLYFKYSMAAESPGPGKFIVDPPPTLETKQYMQI